MAHTLGEIMVLYMQDAEGANLHPYDITVDKLMASTREWYKSYFGQPMPVSHNDLRGLY